MNNQIRLLFILSGLYPTDDIPAEGDTFADILTCWVPRAGDSIFLKGDTSLVTRVLAEYKEDGHVIGHVWVFNI